MRVTEWRICYAPSPYLRTDRESKSTTVMQKQEGSFISSVLGLKSHPTQGNPTRAPNKGVWQLIYRQLFVSGVAGVTWLARQDEHISCLFLVNMTEVLEPVVWSLTVTGKFGLGIRNEAGPRLIEFCQENTLFTSNTLFQQHKRWLYTWT